MQTLEGLISHRPYSPCKIKIEALGASSSQPQSPHCSVATKVWNYPPAVTGPLVLKKAKPLANVKPLDRTPDLWLQIRRSETLGTVAASPKESWMRILVPWNKFDTFLIVSTVSNFLGSVREARFTPETSTMLRRSPHSRDRALKNVFKLNLMFSAAGSVHGNGPDELNQLRAAAKLPTERRRPSRGPNLWSPSRSPGKCRWTRIRCQSPRSGGPAGVQTWRTDL